MLALLRLDNQFWQSKMLLSFPIPPSIQDNNDLFMLTIRGTSMIKARVFNGDQVIVRKQSTAKMVISLLQ